MFEMFEDYIVLAIWGICLCVGAIIKNWIPTQAINKWIPTILGPLGILLNIWMNKGVSVDIVFVGLVSGLAATGAYEIKKQLTKHDRG